MSSAPRQEEALAVGVLAAATAFACRGLLGGTFAARDTAFTLVAMEHLQGALLDGRDWTRGPLAWPLEGSVAQTDWVLGQALLALPLRLLGLDPAVTHDATVFLGLLLTAWACHRVAAALLGPGPHTWIAGVVGGLSPVQLVHGQHTNLVWHGPAVLGALLLGIGLETRRPGLTLAGGLVAALGAQFGFYVGLHGALIAACVLGAAAAARVGDGRSWGAAAAGLGLGAAAMIPPIAVWSAFAARHAIDVPLQELRDASWHLSATLAPVGGAPLHGPLQAVWPAPGGGPRNQWMNPPNPGYLALFLALYGARARSGPGWAWAAIGAAGGLSLLLALGPDLVIADPGGAAPAPYRLLLALPGVSGLREPGRWLAVASIALAPLAAAGVRRLGLGRVGVAALIGVALLEIPPLRTSPWGASALEPAYLALDDVTVEGALYDEALRRDGRCGARGGHAIRAQLFHQRPLVGGVWARRFDALEATNRVAGGWPSPEALALFREIGVVVTFEHPPLASMALEGVECTVADGHRTCVIGEAPPPWPRTRTIREESGL